MEPSSEILPHPDTNLGYKEANNKLHAMITGLKTSETIDVNNVITDLEYVAEVLSCVIANSEE